MWFALRPVEIDFLTHASKVYVVTAYVRAPRAAVFRAFADASTWHLWWPGVLAASYGTSKKPYGVGTHRESYVDGQRYEETMLAWDEGTRWAYRIDRATLPVATAQIECTEFADREGGTTITWTIAHDPRVLSRLLAPFFAGIMRRMLTRASHRLEAHLAIEAHATGPS